MMYTKDFYVHQGLICISYMYTLYVHLKVHLYTKDLCDKILIFKYIK